MKRIKGIIVTTLVLCISIIGYSIYNNSLNINEENILESTKETSMNNLAIMLQNDEGIYEQKDMDTWPTEGYAFNDILSHCEHGGHLEWDGKSVVLTVKGSDKCYVYFDKYEPIKITDVKTNVVVSWDRVDYTITITATGGKGKLSYGISTKSGFDNILWQESNVIYGSSDDCIDMPYIKIKDESNNAIEEQIDLHSGHSSSAWYVC